MGGIWRISEKEAIERGIIQPPASPPPEPADTLMQTATTWGLRALFLAIAWYVGFVMGLTLAGR